jgi:hypothetical protein
LPQPSRSVCVAFAQELLGEKQAADAQYASQVALLRKQMQVRLACCFPIQPRSRLACACSALSLTAPWACLPFASCPPRRSHSRSQSTSARS